MELFYNKYDARLKKSNLTSTERKQIDDKIKGLE